MKKLLAALLILLVPLLMGQDIIYTDLATVEWDAVTTFINGDPIPAGWIVEYEVLISDPMQSLGITADTTATFAVIWLEDKAVGVKTIVTENDGVTKHYSEITRSDIEGIPVPFRLCSATPNPPLGLRLR